MNFNASSQAPKVGWHEGSWPVETGAFSRCNSLESIVLPSTIEFISKNAFYGCESLNNVYYDGTSEDWKLVVIEENNNFLLNSTIQYKK